MSTQTPKRKYRKRRRAELEAQTRRRIAEAAMRLHGSVGPARTTIKAVADEARVQRATVYRHFPDEASLFDACSAHFASLNPPPDPAAWERIADPDDRLCSALTELYEWYAWAEPMLTNTTRDAPLVPAMARPVERTRQLLDAMRAALVRGRPERGRKRQRVAAAIGHALTFATWRSLVREQGLEITDAVELITGLVESAGGGSRAL
jgi:AcrR family transcriptional regulator